MQSAVKPCRLSSMPAFYSESCREICTNELKALLGPITLFAAPSELFDRFRPFHPPAESEKSCRFLKSVSIFQFS